MIAKILRFSVYTWQSCLALISQKKTFIVFSLPHVRDGESRMCKYNQQSQHEDGWFFQNVASVSFLFPLLSNSTFVAWEMEKEMATHSSILAWRIPGTEEPGGLLSMGSHRVRHDWSDSAAAAATYLLLVLRNWTGVSCIAGRFLTNWAIREAHSEIY